MLILVLVAFLAPLGVLGRQLWLDSCRWRLLPLALLAASHFFVLQRIAQIVWFMHASLLALIDFLEETLIGQINRCLILHELYLLNGLIIMLEFLKLLRSYLQPCLILHIY